MNPAIPGSLPPAALSPDLARGAPDRRHDACERQLAWQRAMEQALGGRACARASDRAAPPREEAGAPAGAAARPTAGRRSGPVAAIARAVASTAALGPRPVERRGPGTPAAGRGESVAEATPPPAAAPARSADDASPRGADAGPAAPVEVRVEIGAPLAPPGSPRASGAAPPGEPGASPKPATRGAGGGQASAADAPLRIHAESSDDGIRVWLGADRVGDASLEEWARPIVQELARWASARGERLAAVTCNGRRVFGVETSGRERPGPAPAGPLEPAAIPDHQEDVPWP